MERPADNVFGPGTDFLYGKNLPGFFFHGRHCDVCDAARDNRIERREVTADVQGKTVHRDPVANAHADRRDLAFGNPHAGQPSSRLRRDPERGKQLDHHLLDPAKIAVQVLSASSQINNRITDELPGPMIGCLAATINREKRMRKVRGTAQARLIRRPANRVNRLVLEQK